MMRRRCLPGQPPPRPRSLAVGESVPAACAARQGWCVLGARGGLAAALLAAVAGCSMIPAYQRPPAPVAAQFPGSDGTPAALRAADIEWRRFFTDPRLQQLIEIGLQNNRDLRVALLNIERARALYQVQRADELPTVNATGQHNNQRIPGGASPVGTGYLLRYHQLGIGITSFELDFFGRVRSLGEQALATYLATEEARKNTQIVLVAAIANAWLTLLADDELLALAGDTLKTREESQRLAQLRFDSGVASELDLRQSQTLLESARASLAQLTRQRAFDENALVLLAGQSLPADLTAGRALNGQDLLADIPPGLPSDLLVTRPDIRAAEQQLIAANANIGAARANLFPRIALTTSVGVASRELSDLFSIRNKSWSFIPGVSLPIFDGGRNRASLEVSQVNRDIAVAQYEKSIQTAFREVADALAGRAALAAQLKSLQAQADAENARFKLSDLRYRGGVASHLDLLDAQRSLYGARQAVIQTQLQQLQNQVNLYKALGGGWTGPPAPAAAPVARGN